MTKEFVENVHGVDTYVPSWPTIEMVGRSLASLGLAWPGVGLAGGTLEAPHEGKGKREMTRTGTSGRTKLRLPSSCVFTVCAVLDGP
jgi:hypothetical protein